MDRTLIQRMIGATVLVLLLVLFAPALLDGRKEEVSTRGSDRDGEMRTEVIVLNAPVSPEMPSADAESTTTELLSDEGVSSPELTTATPVTQTEPITPAARISRPAPPVAVVAPVEKPVQAVIAPAKDSPIPSGFGVQLGSFSSRENADKYAAAARADGFTVFILKPETSSTPVYRVYAGPRETRASAESLAAQLAASGRGVLVVDLSAQKNR